MMLPGPERGTEAINLFPYKLINHAKSIGYHFSIQRSSYKEIPE
jgi:hypothetical protein